jgi:hypothetical protein
MGATEIWNEDVSEFANGLEAMTTDEVFVVISLLKKQSEDDTSDREETLSRISVEEEIERRFPGKC